MAEQLQDWALDNILVGQKNKILWLINEGFLSEARAALDVLFPLWSACGYLYKREEIERRLTEATRAALETV